MGSNNELDMPFVYGEGDSLLTYVMFREEEFQVLDDVNTDLVMIPNHDNLIGFSNLKIALRKHRYDLIKDYLTSATIIETYRTHKDYRETRTAELVLELEGITVDNAVMLKLLW